jgi:diaminohydroxyphosphoribosylaminopyrimidine deaminase/5-amino-6-(5-phosphoribosylamino)uracil reductase
MAEAGIEVEVGPGAEAARRDHAGHIRRVQEGRPQVLLKLAVSADGKVALAGRRPAAITGEAARARVHRMRAMHDAVVTGIGTALADDPLLTCRLPGMHSPVRVVFDRALRLPLRSRLVATAREVPLWIIAAEDAAPEREQALRAAGAEVLRVPAAAGGVDLAAALKLLAERGLTRVMVEAGPLLATGLLKAALIDEVALFSAPASIGTDGLDALDGLPLSALTRGLASRGRETVGADRLELFERS